MGGDGPPHFFPMLSYLDPILFPDTIEIVEMPDGRYVYPIFKCGSSSIKGANPKYVSPRHIRQLQQVDVYLREPLDRYVSGVQTWLRNNPDLDRETALSMISHYMFLDRHFALQFHWLANLARHAPNCWITLNNIDDLGDITDRTWNVLTRDQDLIDRFNQHSKLHFYLGLDKILYHELRGQCLTFTMILAYIKVNHRELYDEIIQTTKDLCAVLD